MNISGLIQSGLGMKINGSVEAPKFFHPSHSNRALPLVQWESTELDSGPADFSGGNAFLFPGTLFRPLSKSY